MFEGFRTSVSHNGLRLNGSSFRVSLSLVFSENLI